MEGTKFFIIENIDDETDVLFDEVKEEIRYMLYGYGYKVSAVMDYVGICKYCDGVREIISKCNDTNIENYK